MDSSGSRVGGLRQITRYHNNQFERIEEELRLYWQSAVDEPLPAEILILMSVLERNERDHADPVRRSP